MRFQHPESMAWNPSPEVQDCREIAQRRGFKQVIVIGIKPEQGTFSVVSYGETRALCNNASRAASQIHELISNGTIAPEL